MYKLFAVVAGDTYPPQCVVVWERKESADALADHLNATIRNVCEVREVESFFPRGMCEPDSAWINATSDYIKGMHQNG